jgi:hypothetical protein
MTKYLISFPSSAMDHIPQDEFPEVSAAAHAVLREAKAAGVWVFGGGINEQVPPLMVAGDGSTAQETYPQTKILMGALPYWKYQPGKKPLNGQERLQFLADASKNYESFNLTPSLENLKLKH